MGLRIMWLVSKKKYDLAVEALDTLIVSYEGLAKILISQDALLKEGKKEMAEVQNNISKEILKRCDLISEIKKINVPKMKKPEIEKALNEIIKSYK